jgi:hypothetical protein
MDTYTPSNFLAWLSGWKQLFEKVFLFVFVGTMLNHR